MTNKKQYKKQSTPKSFDYSDEWFTPRESVIEMISFGYLGTLIPQYIANDYTLTIMLPFDSEQSEFVKVLKEINEYFGGDHIKLIYGIRDYLSAPVGTYVYDYLITNPPFSIKNEVISKCLEYMNHFANDDLYTSFNLLLPIETLGSVERNEIYTRTANGVPTNIFIPKRRIKFTDAGAPNKSGANFHSIYMEWLSSTHNEQVWETSSLRFDFEGLPKTMEELIEYIRGDIS